VAKVLANAASGPACATGREGNDDAHLQGLLDARQRLIDARDIHAASRLTGVICARLRDRGDLDRAAALGQATLEEMPSPSASAAHWLHELGTLAQLRGDDELAADRYLLAVQMFADVGDAAGVACSYDSLGVLAHARGDYQQAERYYRAATCFHATDPAWPAPAETEPAIAIALLPEAGAACQSRGRPPGAPPAALALTTIAPACGPAAGQQVSEAACAEAARAGGALAGAPGPGDAETEGGRSGPSRIPAASEPRPRRLGRGAPGGRGGIRPAVLTAGTIAAAAAVAIAATAGSSQPGRAADRADLAGAGVTLRAPAGAVVAGRDRAAAAAWVARQASSGAVVGCDPAMCTALRARGVPAGNLLIIGSGGQPDPLGSDLVVATAAIRGTLGSRLAQVYAPLVLARFGTGSARIDVRVTAPGGSAAYLQALGADRAAGVTAGRQLLRNRGLSAAAAAGRALAAGQVDPRLLTTIAALTALYRLRLVQLGPSGPGADPRVPWPAAELAAAGPGPAGPELRAVAAFLRAQRPPYLASSITIARPADGRPVLRVVFGEPSPLGLLGPAS
jgi:hypothetical protein